MLYLKQTSAGTEDRTKELQIQQMSFVLRGSSDKNIWDIRDGERSGKRVEQPMNLWRSLVLLGTRGLMGKISPWKAVV